MHLATKVESLDAQILLAQQERRQHKRIDVTIQDLRTLFPRIFQAETFFSFFFMELFYTHKWLEVCSGSVTAQKSG